MMVSPSGSEDFLQQIQSLQCHIRSHPRSWALNQTASESFECCARLICESLAVLQRAKEESRATKLLLSVIESLEKTSFFTCISSESSERILDSLRRFADEHGHWNMVEEYAKKETGDLAILAMTITARILEKAVSSEPGELKPIPIPPVRGQLIDSGIDYRSTLGLTAGVHFFEALVLMERKVSIGWATARWKHSGSFIDHRSVDEKNLIQQWIDPTDEQHFIGFYLAYFPIGTVLGCLLDVPRRTFAFFVDGNLVSFKEEVTVTFSSNAYYVRARVRWPNWVSLYVNFGQVTFKHGAPLACHPINQVNGANRYTLYSEDYLRAMPLSDNQVEPMFRDEKQQRVKQTIEKLLKDGEVTKDSVLEAYEQLRYKGKFNSETYDLRWLQAIIEWEAVVEEQASLWMRPMENTKSIERQGNAWLILMETFVSMTIEGWKFEQFLVPYSKLQAEVDAQAMTKNLAILFATKIQYFAHFYKKYYEDFQQTCPLLSPYLVAAFIVTDDPATAMFALIGLQTVNEVREKEEDLESDEMDIESDEMQIEEMDIEKVKIDEMESDEFTSKLANWKVKIDTWNQEENVWKLNLAPNLRHPYAQLQLIIHNYEQSLTSSSSPPGTPTSPSRLSPSDCSPEIKLSSDRLSLRSDWQWQSARSQLSIDNSLSLPSPLFFYEVTLHTSGPMRVGWGTQRWQVAREEVGNTEFSIGYDGYSRCIWHQGVQFRLENARQWKAGDVIGCLLNFTTKQFIFYQNGRQIKPNSEINSEVSKLITLDSETKVHFVFEKNDSLTSLNPYFSTHPYYAAISLSAYQQCIVNFGHTFFAFPPKFLDIWDFQLYSSHLKIHGPSKKFKSNQINIGTAINPIITVDGQVTTGDLTMNHSTVPSKLSPEPEYTVHKPITCCVCKQVTICRLRKLVDCPHLKFCRECASDNIECKKC